MSQPLSTDFPAVRVGSYSSGTDAEAISAMLANQLSDTPLEFAGGAKFMIVLGYLLDWGLLGYLFTEVARGSWSARLSPALQLIGIYSLSLAISGALGGFQRMLNVSDSNMTSSNIFHFTRANLGFLVGLGLIISAGIPSTYKFLISIPFLLMTLLYTALHILVIMPLTYLAYAFVGAALDGFSNLNAGGTFKGGNLAQPLDVSSVAASQQTTIKGLLVGIPALLLAVTLGFIQLFHA
jgi:hypothetical protein